MNAAAKSRNHCQADSQADEQEKPPVRVTAGLEYKIMVQLKRIVPDRFVEFMLRKLYA